MIRLNIGDLVFHRDRLWMERTTMGIITGIHPRSREFTFVDVLWSDKEHSILGYMPSELRLVNESR